MPRLPSRAPPAGGAELETAQAAVAGARRQHLQDGRALGAAFQQLIGGDELLMRLRRLEPQFDHHLPVGRDFEVGHRPGGQRDERIPHGTPAAVKIECGATRRARGAYQHQAALAPQLERHEIPGGGAGHQVAVERIRESVRRAVNRALQVSAARRHQRVRPAPAGVAEGVQPAALGAHHQRPLGGELTAHVVPGGAQLGFVPQHLPGGPQQLLTFGAQQRLVRVGARRQPAAVGGGAHHGERGRRDSLAEVAGEHRAQIAQRALDRRDPIDVGLALEGKALPQHLEHADEAERHTVRIEVRRAAAGDHALDQLAHQHGEVVVLLAADVQVFLARAGLAPERVPHRDLARTGDIGIQIQVDQQPQRLHRRVLEARHRQHDALLELCRQVLERGHQHGRLGLEVEPHDARRQVRQRHDLLHRGARGTVDVQRGDAGIDQPLPLPLANARTAATGRFRGGACGLLAPCLVHRPLVCGPPGSAARCTGRKSIAHNSARARWQTTS